MKILSMAIDIVTRNFIERLGLASSETGDACLEGLHRGLLRAQNNIVDFALAWSEMAIYRCGTRDIRGIHRVLACYVHYNHVSSLHTCRVSLVNQTISVLSRSHN